MVNMIIESPVRILKAEDKQKQKFAWHEGEENEDKAGDGHSAEPQENLISHQSEVLLSLSLSLSISCPHRLFNESDMCSQFVCIKQTNTYSHTHTLTHTHTHILALLFIFMLYDIYAFCQRFAYEAATAMGNAFN